jgi:peptidoglycan-N-acetylglucosamine deacetylase
VNILTFDIEDWFHILDNPGTKTHVEWANYDSRMKHNMDRIYSILESSNCRATFFILGWIAEKYPQLVKEISDRGYEIGSHSRMHQLVYEQDRTTFARDLEYSIKKLEDISGKKVKYYRAPGFSITAESKWAFEILIQNGIEIDCSIFPSRRAHGGFASFPARSPVKVEYNGLEIKELPISVASIFGKSLIFSGGGYFRLLPFKMINYLIENSDYTMTYFHPRDFDEAQPILPGLSMFRKWKSYTGIKGAEKKLLRILKSHEWVDISQAEKNINWETVLKIKL